jgi:hypothetical protein
MSRTQKRKSKRRHTYRRKQHKRRTLIKSDGIPLFSKPIFNKSNKILVNNKLEVGSLIPGLRNIK